MVIPKKFQLDPMNESKPVTGNDFQIFSYSPILEMKESYQWSFSKIFLAMVGEISFIILNSSGVAS